MDTPRFLLLFLRRLGPGPQWAMAGCGDCWVVLLCPFSIRFFALIEDYCARVWDRLCASFDAVFAHV